MTRRPALALAVAALVAGCSAETTSAPGTTAAPSSVAPSAVTTLPAATTSTSSTTSTTVPPSTVPPTTVPPTVPPTVSSAGQAGVTTADTDFLGEEVIGTSAEGRPITAMHRGTLGGTVILVVGVIHGNENAGLAIMDELRTMPIPVGIDLWLLDLMNPDGYANDVRHNGNGVDLNRNFPHDWTQIGEPGYWEYSGTGPASEPETQAFIAFAERIQPELTLWYHQDLYRISPSSRRDGPLREEYARLTGLPIISVTGGTYTGVAATWTRNTLAPAMSFIIELGPTLSDADAVMHAEAVLAISGIVVRGEV